MKQRDLELLSSYLDGQLSTSDAARLESRLLTDRELRSVLRDLRSARSVLRQLPMRKAPRNFTLTPKMVGKNPPLPRAYPVFRFSTTLATILLFLSFGLNLLRPQLAATVYPFGIGGSGGGGAPDTTLSAESAPAAQAPAATEAPAATQAPAATEAPTESTSVAMAPLATMTAPAIADTARAADTAIAKNSAPAIGMGGGLQQPPPSPIPSTTPLVSAVWQWILAGVALLSAFVMALMRQLSISRWRKKN